MGVACLGAQILEDSDVRGLRLLQRVWPAILSRRQVSFRGFTLPEVNVGKEGRSATAAPVDAVNLALPNGDWITAFRTPTPDTAKYLVNRVKPSCRHPYTLSACLALSHPSGDATSMERQGNACAEVSETDRRPSLPRTPSSNRSSAPNVRVRARQNAMVPPQMVTS